MLLPRLKDLRDDADLTQEDLAKLLHVEQATYSNYERGKYEISLEALIALAKLYQVSTDYILGLTNVKTPPPKLPKG